jgi:site-specific recombinase XerD
MATVNFLYRSSKENANLILRLLYRDSDKDYVLGAKTKIEVSKNYWKNEHKSNSRDISIKNKQFEINKEINKLDRHIINAFNNNQIENISKEWLKSIVFEYYNPITEKNISKIPTDLINFIDVYIKRKTGEVRKTSIVKFRTIQNKMKRFQKKRNHIIYIRNINEDFKQEFLSYYKSESYNIGTASKELDIIKSFCYYAKELGLQIDSQLKKLKIPIEKSINIYLNNEDIAKIENIDKSKLSERLENVRDWLVISCFMGQRVSDFLRFKKEMIRYESGLDGIKNPYIDFIQDKTNKSMTIPVHPKVVEYLNKRNGEFPKKISNQKYNEYIKEVCVIAEFNDIIYGKKQLNISKVKGETKMRAVYDYYPTHELITSHIGRRSFATNFYGKIPTNYLRYITGHSSEGIFLGYMNKSNKDLALEITNYFQSTL